MEEKLKVLMSKIFNNDGKRETCFALEKEMIELLKDAPPELEREFAESGAGELIYMLADGFRYEDSMNKN